MLAMLFTAALALQDPASPPPLEGPVRQVWMTNDSAPGWVPSEELEAQARETLAAFLEALDHGRYAEAYAMQNALNKAETTADRFAAEQREFRVLAGAVRLRQVNRITWTKDPASAPAPGVYAAIDLTSRFENIDRHCGYLILYQPPEGGAFTVMRQESNFMDNKTARNVTGSRGIAVDRVWAQLVQRCPNYQPAPGGQ